MRSSNKPIFAIWIIGVAIMAGLIYGTTQTETVVKINNQSYVCMGAVNRINALCIQCILKETNQLTVICHESNTTSTAITEPPSSD